MYMYVCMCDVRHDIQIPCTRYVTINRLYLYLIFIFMNVIGLVRYLECISSHQGCLAKMGLMGMDTSNKIII